MGGNRDWPELDKPLGSEENYERDQMMGSKHDREKYIHAKPSLRSDNGYLKISKINRIFKSIHERGSFAQENRGNIEGVGYVTPLLEKYPWTEEVD